MIEIKRLLNYLVTNGYEFKETREAFDDRYQYPDDAIALFSKKLSYSDTEGNWINDSGIKVSIQFETRADYKNFEKNAYDEDKYIGEPETFITGLIEEIKTSTSSLGGKAKRNKRKTRKNKSSKNFK